MTYRVEAVEIIKWLKLYMTWYYEFNSVLFNGYGKQPLLSKDTLVGSFRSSDSLARLSKQRREELCVVRAIVRVRGSTETDYSSHYGPRTITWTFGEGNSVGKRLESLLRDGKRCRGRKRTFIFSRTHMYTTCGISPFEVPSRSSRSLAITRSSMVLLRSRPIRHVHNADAIFCRDNMIDLEPCSRLGD